MQPAQRIGGVQKPAFFTHAHTSFAWVSLSTCWPQLRILTTHKQVQHMNVAKVNDFLGFTQSANCEILTFQWLLKKWTISLYYLIALPPAAPHAMPFERITMQRCVCKFPPDAKLRVFPLMVD